MVYIILNKDLTLKKRWYDADSIMQYSIVPITLYIKTQPNDNEFSMTFVRPDGYKSSDRGLAYQGYVGVEGEFYHKYVSELRPYHTNIIPGSSATGIGYLSFTYKKLDLETNNIEDVKSSSILKLTIYRSQEPEIEEIEPPEVVEELRSRITNIENLYQQLIDLGIDDIDEFFEKEFNLIHFGDEEPVGSQPDNGLWLDLNNELAGVPEDTELTNDMLTYIDMSVEEAIDNMEIDITDLDKYTRDEVDTKIDEATLEGADGDSAYMAYVKSTEDTNILTEIEWLASLEGPQGPQGDSGPVGPIGPEGPEGPKGLKGDKGDKGDKGNQGPQGIEGPKGPKGEQGDQGLTGDTGPKGDQGLQGVQGDVGPEGPKGDQGIQGIQGIQGVEGPEGPEGPKGLRGEGFQIARIYDSLSELLADTTLNNDEFGLVAGTLDPMHEDYGKLYVFEDGAWTYVTDMSVPGAEGIEGPEGPQGPKGEKGDQGIQGPEGQQGIKGDKGEQGLKGLTGDTGPKGDKGDQGPIGPKGLTGDTGPQGPQGIEGPKGDKGDKGDTGPTEGDPFDISGTYSGLRAQATTQTDVGLDSVQNYAIASEEQAETGTANDKYMTPLRTKQAITTLVEKQADGGSSSIVFSPSDDYIEGGDA